MKTFEKILESPVEEDCQRFLSSNKEILLSTFQREVCIPKFKFGNEFISDFVLFERSSLGHFITLIELEPPTEKPFTQNGKYAKRLNDAIGQINDWFAWISENNDYFLRTMIAAIKYSTAPAWIKSFAPEWLDSLNERNVFIDAKIIIGRRVFLSDEDNKRRKAIYQTTNKTIEITHYDRLLDRHERDIQSKIALDENASIDELDRLSKSKFSEIRQLVAVHKNTKASILELLADDPTPAVLYSLARNERLPYKGIHKLIVRHDNGLNRMLIKNSSLGEEFLATLFENNDMHLRRAILEHQNCPEVILIRASQSTDHGYRRRAAQHPNLKDETTLERLANDKEAFVRTGVSINPNLPRQITAKLSTDPDRKVRVAANYQNTSASEEVLIAGLQNENEWVRGEIAKHVNLKQKHILAQLVADASYLVRIGLTENKNISSKIKKMLLNDPDKRVRAAAQIYIDDKS